MGVMSNLLVLWEAEVDGVDKGLGRAVELYSRAVRERNDRHAIFPLVSLLSRGGEDVEVDIPRP